MEERVDRPAHYRGKKYDVIDIIEEFDLNFSRGNVVKYSLRAGRKDEAGYSDLAKELEDLKKGAWYLNREIERIQNLIDNEAKAV